MAELYGKNLGIHVQSIFSEFKAKESIYGYPKRKIFTGFPGYDFSVQFHDKTAATPLGPASGPHTQLAQNIVLSFLGGGRIMELKTIQILDQLEIPRPCIDVRNIGFNVEWSQELCLEDSLREYVTAWVLLKIIEETELLEIPRGDSFYQTVFDISVGYDLKGISSEPVRNWLQRITHAEAEIARALETLPPRFAHLKKIPIDPHIANSATLSTFHGCPRDEIEAIVQHLIREHDLHVIVKMNPTLLGYDAVKEILHDRLGYHHIQLDPEAFDHDLQFDEAVAMMKRLQDFARQYGKNVGAKFTNTLVVKNNQSVFKDEVMYLSGVPLHVISMNTMHRFRSEMGDDFPISFSAGINKRNFPDAVLCNMKPITVCTDLLKEGGYTRLAVYLKNLKTAMEKTDARDIEAFILANAPEEHRDSISSAGVANAGRIVPRLSEQPEYQYQANRKEPRKVDSHLALFDCLTCNKCLPVCPNAANFSIPAEARSLPITNYRYQDGDFIPLEDGLFTLEKKAQIANLADFCNECGNCDTYCPEHGGPYIEKPRFFFSDESYRRFSNYDGFYFPDPNTLKGRIAGTEYLLSFNPTQRIYLWKSPAVEFLIDAENRLVTGMERARIAEQQVIEMKPYYTMRTLLDGILEDPQAYNSVMLRETSE